MPLLMLVLISALSGCQLLEASKSDRVDLSHYYLWIKSLNEKEIAQEITLQQSDESSGSGKSDVQLIMLYSLPNSPIHNPYTAKTLLNEYPLPPYHDTSLSTSDLAFIVMLKDQLNQQLLLLKKITNYKGAYQQAKKVSSAQEVKINQQNKKIEQLHKQIIQLKKIEKTISKRGQ
jgi:hypothetical protein